jgi:tRNA pseudouridine13 synthase
MSLKLKSRPEDFEVEELTEFPRRDGPFAVYLLTKRSLGTPEAITAIQRRWDLSRPQISYGGLKDKHAVTRQWVTIHRGPKQNLEQTNLSLVYQGQAANPFTPHEIVANRFAIILRNLDPAAVPNILAAAERVPRDGVPNYFDDQRFGSVGVSGEFLAKAWCLGDYERTLWLALAEPNLHDRPDDRAQKETLRNLWGQWEACKAALPKSSLRSVVTFLCDHPTDFRRAVALIRQDLRSLYLAAFQSHLWNRLLAAQLRETIAPDRTFPVTLEGGPVPFFSELSDDERSQLQALDLPLPSARLHFDEGDPRQPLYERVAADAGLELREMRVKYPRDAFFSKGERSALSVPRDWRAVPLPDELNPGKHAIQLRFVLPRGSYATIVVKRLTAGEAVMEPAESQEP